MKKFFMIALVMMFVASAASSQTVNISGSNGSHEASMLATSTANGGALLHKRT